MNPEDLNKPPVTPPVVTPEPVVSPAVTPDPVVQPVETSTPPIDEATITEKVSKGVLAKLSEAFGLTKKEEEQLPTDPKELLKLAEERGSEAAKKVLEDREEDARFQQESQEKQITEGAQKFQQLWLNQYKDLANANRVPQIVNAQDPNDPGNVAKVQILTRLKQILDENQANGIDYVPTLKEVFYETPNILSTATTTGANVPVSGGGRTTSSTNGLAYSALNKMDIDDIVKAKYEN